MLKFETIEPSQPADATVILLHGLGASGYDLIDMPKLLAPGEHTIRFILPHAPSRPVTLNMGMVMPAWYDIMGLTAESREDVPGFEASREKIDWLIQQEMDRGISSERIILGGFSQGGAMTLFTGLQAHYRLAGLIVLSAYFPCAAYTQQRLSHANRQTPIFLGHGNRDAVVPFAWGETTHEMLNDLGYPVNWHSYPIGHEVSPVEISAVARFIHQQLASSGTTY